MRKVEHEIHQRVNSIIWNTGVAPELPALTINGFDRGVCVRRRKFSIRATLVLIARYSVRYLFSILLDFSTEPTRCNKWIKFCLYHRNEFNEIWWFYCIFENLNVTEISKKKYPLYRLIIEVDSLQLKRDYNKAYYSFSQLR